MHDVTIVSVSYNTKELTCLLLWSLHRILDAADVPIVIVDNASSDGSAAMLRRAADAGLCELIESGTNVGHGEALNVAMATPLVADANRVWILDSDCVITRPDALKAALTAAPDAAVIGETHWDKWHRQDRFELYSLIVDHRALAVAGPSPFSDDGDPSWDLLQSVNAAGLGMVSFPFTRSGYLVHLGRGTLAAVAAAGETDNPRYEWATEHHEPHYGGVAEAEAAHCRVVGEFRSEVGPDLDIVNALRR